MGRKEVLTERISGKKNSVRETVAARNAVYLFKRSTCVYVPQSRRKLEQDRSPTHNASD